MPLTPPGNGDDIGGSRQSTLRKNAAEPVEQILKQSGHTRLMNASSYPTVSSRLSRVTVCVTADRETFAPCSSLDRPQVLVAVCRCLCQLTRSPTSCCPITGKYRSIIDACDFLTDGTAGRSSFMKYLCTVDLLTYVFRAIGATGSSSRHKRWTDHTWGTLIIILLDPFWRRYRHYPVRTISWSARFV